MPEYKSQHTVPQFYLRNFSSDGTNIGGLSLRTQKTFIGPIRNQACRDYYYEKGSQFEDILKSIEDPAAIIIKNIIHSNSPPDDISEDWVNLLHFVYNLSLRTELVGKQINKATDAASKLSLRHHPDFAKFESYLADSSFQYEYPNTFILKAATFYVPVLSDLKSKLIINTTSVPFITSDNPVIPYNMLLEPMNLPFSNVGCQMKGLQYFLPITSDMMLVYYDEARYSVGASKKEVLRIKRTEDVHALNGLQVANANKVILFQQDTDTEYVKSLYSEYSQYRQNALVDVNEHIASGSTKEKGQSLITVSPRDARTNLKLTFLKPRKGALDFNPNNMKELCRDIAAFTMSREVEEAVSAGISLDEAMKRAKARYFRSLQKRIS